MAGGIGSAIALGAKIPRDPYVLQDIADDQRNRLLERKQRQAQEAADAKSYVKATDFSKDYDKMLPLYSNEVADIMKPVAEKATMLKNQGRSDWLSKVQPDIYEAKQKMKFLRQQSDNMKSYIGQKEDHYKLPEIVSLANNPNARVKDLSRLQEMGFSQKGIHADPTTGEFSFAPVEIFDWGKVINFDPNKDYDTIETGRTSYKNVRPGMVNVEVKSQLKPDVKQRLFDQLIADPVAVADAMFNIGQEKYDNPELAVVNAIWDKIDMIGSHPDGKPVYIPKRDLAYNKPKPPKAVDAINTGTTRKVGNNIWNMGVKPGGTEVITFTKSDATANKEDDFIDPKPIVKTTPGGMTQVTDSNAVVRGIPQRFEYNNGQGFLIVHKPVYKNVQGKDVKTGAVDEVPVPLTIENIQKIKGEYGLDPDTFRSMLNNNTDGSTTTGTVKTDATGNVAEKKTDPVKTKEVVKTKTVETKKEVEKKSGKDWSKYKRKS